MKILPLFVIIPFASAFLTALLAGRVKKFGAYALSLTSLILLLLSFGVLRQVSAYKILIYKISGWLPPLGICLVVDGLSSFMLLTVNLVSFIVSIYAISYMNKYGDTWKFYSLFSLMLAGMNGIIISGDLFNLYIFLEISSLTGYALVAFGQEPQDLEASFKYMVMGALASIFILLSIALIYSYTSTLNMADISLVLASKPKGPLIVFISVLFLAGFSFKAALVPFHAWLPDAHSCAPGPVSAILSGVFIKVLGFYALTRVFFNILGASSSILFALMLLGVLSMIVGAFLAVAQNDIKRMLAYSSISQIGYIAFALGIGSPLALLGGLLHLFNHAILKSLLFLNAGAIEHATGRRDLNNLGGLGDNLPVTKNTSFLAAMGISGIPPLGAFWSKLIIIIAACQAGYIVFAFIAVLVSIVTLVYYLKFQTRVFYGDPDESLKGIKEGPWLMRLATIILAVFSVVAGLILLPHFRGFLQDAVNVLVSGQGYAQNLLQAIK